MFLNKLSSHNQTAVFSEDDLDVEILGNQERGGGQEIIEDIKEDDSDDFDFVQQDGDSDNDGGT